MSPKVRTQNRQNKPSFAKCEEPPLMTAICGKYHSGEELVYEPCRQRRSRRRRHRKTERPKDQGRYFVNTNL